MTVAPDRAQLVKELARMMDELCAPELTLARSEFVRSRVARLLDTLGERNESSGFRADDLPRGTAGQPRA